jgi:Tol biopolymer transport system component
VFTSTRDGRPAVWVVSAAGEAAGLRAVAVDDVAATVDTPAWSPDGQSLIVASDGRSARRGYPALWFLRNLGL